MQSNVNEPNSILFRKSIKKEKLSLDVLNHLRWMMQKVLCQADEALFVALDFPTAHERALLKIESRDEGMENDSLRDCSLQVRYVHRNIHEGNSSKPVCHTAFLAATGDIIPLSAHTEKVNDSAFMNSSEWRHILEKIAYHKGWRGVL